MAVSSAISVATFFGAFGRLVGMGGNGTVWGSILVLLVIGVVMCLGVMVLMVILCGVSFSAMTWVSMFRLVLAV